MDQHTVLSPNLLFTQLHKLTTINAQLKDAGIQQSLQPPRIIIIGMSSTGKSSVLESIIGLDFLPKGEGPAFPFDFSDFLERVITRRPIEIKLVHLPSSSILNKISYLNNSSLR